MSWSFIIKFNISQILLSYYVTFPGYIIESSHTIEPVDNIFQIELFICSAIQFVMKLNVDRQFAIYIQSTFQFHMENSLVIVSVVFRYIENSQVYHDMVPEVVSYVQNKIVSSCCY